MITIDEQLAVGTQVPNFELETYDPGIRAFSKLSLAEIRAKGKWLVLVFYPADFTFVCPTELADLANHHAFLEDIGVEVASVSTDTKYAHLAWHRDEKLLVDVNFQMAADPTRTLAKLFGVYDEASGMALRGTFIINPAGVLVSAEVNYFSVGRNAEELRRKLQAFAHVWENPEEACPARWKPGARTLTPSEKTVGRVFEALGEKVFAAM